MDNISVTPGSGVTVAGDDISGVLHQRVKLVLGSDGISDGDVSSSNPIPASLTAAQIAILTPLIDRITAALPYSNRLSDGSSFYDARLIRALTPADIISLPASQITALTPPTTVATINVLETTSTGTITSAANATSSFTALAANAARKGFIIFNDSTATVSIAFAATASLTAFTLRLTANSSYFSTQLPIYRGIITAISSAATGNLRVTELT